MFTLTTLPALNATLNATSGILLLLGHHFMRKNNIHAHRICMLSAFGVSILFLISYLTYHIQVGTTRFPGQGWARPVYFTILISHTILAIVIVPLAIITLTWALRKMFDRHKKIARWTYPIWLYISITGVIIYLMLYQIFPHTV